MEFTQIMSWLGFISGLLIGIPQLIKTIRTKSAKDVSALTFLLIIVTCICLLVRAVAIWELAFISYYVFLILSSSLQLFLIWKYRYRAGRKLQSALGG
ncbi:PQ-loop domain-containing transporter [Thermodesulfobacteriota bacterium]